MFSLLVFIFILGILIMVHEFGHFIAAKKIGVKVNCFSLGFGPKLFKHKTQETEYTLSAIPLGGYVQLAGDTLEAYSGKPNEYYAHAPWRRAIIIFCGPLLNYALGIICFWLIFFAGYPTLTTKVGGVLPGYGAEAAGLRKGDRIVAIDGKKIQLWEELQGIIHTKKNAVQVRLSVLRGNQELSFDVRIHEKKLEDVLGNKRKVGLLGITASEELKKIRHGFFQSFPLAVTRAWELTTLTYEALWRMISGRLSFRESVTGLPGIYDLTSKATKLGIIAVLHLVAALSISLAIFNLLPIPVLDGGHLFFLAVEKIRGKVLSVKAEFVVTRAGLVFIIALAVIVTGNDIIRLYGDKITKFLGK